MANILSALVDGIFAALPAESSGELMPFYALRYGMRHLPSCHFVIWQYRLSIENGEYAFRLRRIMKYRCKVLANIVAPLSAIFISYRVGGETFSPAMPDDALI